MDSVFLYRMLLWLAGTTINAFAPENDSVVYCEFVSHCEIGVHYSEGRWDLSSGQPCRIVCLELS